MKNLKYGSFRNHMRPSVTVSYQGVLTLKSLYESVLTVFLAPKTISVTRGRLSMVHIIRPRRSCRWSILFVENPTICSHTENTRSANRSPVAKNANGRRSFRTLLLFDNIVSVHRGDDRSLAAVYIRRTGPGGGGLVSSPRSLNYASVVFYGQPGSPVSVTAPLIGHRRSG